MNIVQPLKTIQEITGKSQDQLAREFGVTFAAFNRWINGKATPRPQMQKEIQLYLEKLTGKASPGDELQEKLSHIEIQTKELRPITEYLRNNPDVRQQLLLEFTYNTNSIEGSTMTENETASVIFDNTTIASKSLTEHLEAKNHKTAFTYLISHIENGHDIDEGLIMKLHQILMNSIHPDAGLYRNHGVRIVGSRVVTANHIKIPRLMEELCSQISATQKEGLIQQAAQIHAKFEKIHPFADGNGRIGRLILAGMLIKANFPPAVILLKRKAQYYQALAAAQTKENFKPIEMFIMNACLKGLRILLRKP